MNEFVDVHVNEGGGNNNNERCATTMATNVIRIVHVSTSVPPLSTTGPMHVAVSIAQCHFLRYGSTTHYLQCEFQHE